MNFRVVWESFVRGRAWARCRLRSRRGSTGGHSNGARWSPRPRAPILLSSLAGACNVAGDGRPTAGHGAPKTECTVDDQYLKELSKEMNELNRLIHATVICKQCKERLLIDKPLQGITYCKCEMNRAIEDPLTHWQPFLETPDIIIWRREEGTGTGLYEYKIYGRYEEVSGEDFLHMQTDLEYWRSWDNTAFAIRSLPLLNSPRPNQDIVHWTTLWPRFFSNRDYVYVRRYAYVDGEPKYSRGSDMLLRPIPLSSQSRSHSRSPPEDSNKQDQNLVREKLDSSKKRIIQTEKDLEDLFNNNIESADEKNKSVGEDSKLASDGEDTKVRKRKLDTILQSKRLDLGLVFKKSRGILEVKKQERRSPGMDDYGYKMEQRTRAEYGQTLDEIGQFMSDAGISGRLTSGGRGNMIVMTSQSCIHPDAPENKNAVRVKRYWSNLVIKPFTELDKPGIEFSLTYFDDPGTSIPSTLQSWVTGHACPEYLDKMRVAASKYKKIARKKTPILISDKKTTHHELPADRVANKQLLPLVPDSAPGRDVVPREDNLRSDSVIASNKSDRSEESKQVTSPIVEPPLEKLDPIRSQQELKDLAKLKSEKETEEFLNLLTGGGTHSATEDAPESAEDVGEKLDKNHQSQNEEVQQENTKEQMGDKESHGDKSGKSEGRSSRDAGETRKATEDRTEKEGMPKETSVQQTSVQSYWWSIWPLYYFA